MLYQWIKILHVISASVLFGTGLGTALYMLLVNLQKNTRLIAKATAQVVFVDWWFTGTSGVVQLLTGLTLVSLKDYSFSFFWIWGAMAGYGIAACCWFPVVWLQIQCREFAMQAWKNNQPLSKQYHRYFMTWCVLGFVAFLALLCVLFLMANRPETFTAVFTGTPVTAQYVTS